MASKVKKDVKITGIKDIDRRLKMLGPRIAKKVVRKAIRDGMKVMASEVKSRAPVDKGIMRSAVKVRAVKSRKRGDIAIETTISGKVAALVKFTKAGKRVFYPAAVEYGRRHESPNPFMRRAFAAKGEAVRNAAIQQIREGVEEEVTKLP